MYMLHTLSTDTTSLTHVATGYLSHVSSSVQKIFCTAAFCMKGHAAWILRIRGNINANDITNRLDIANTLNNFFTSIGRNLAQNINYSGDKNHSYYLKTYNKIFKFKEIEQENIKTVINSLTNKSSVGIDGISTILLKCIAPSIIKPLTLITNQIMKTGIFPNKLKLAKVIPIYKKDDPTQVTNNRPISLLPVLSKVIEKTIAKQLSGYFEDNILFNQNQYGFRPGHSTEHAALELVDKITSQMDNNKTPINICLGFRYY